MFSILYHILLKVIEIKQKFPKTTHENIHNIGEKSKLVSSIVCKIPILHIPDVYLRKIGHQITILNRYLHYYVQCSITYNSRDMETT